MDDLDQKKVLSGNLIRLLDDRSLTQAEVASAIGVSAQTFNTWCRGIAIPRMDKIQRLADYFKVNKSALIDCEDSAESFDVLFIEKYGQQVFDIVAKYRSLDELDAAKVEGFIESLLMDEKYKKDTSLGAKAI